LSLKNPGHTLFFWEFNGIPRGWILTSHYRAFRCPVIAVIPTI
jgi:hypothetical protein